MTTTKPLNFDAISKSLAAKAQTVLVLIPEFGGEVLLRKLDAVAGLALHRRHAAMDKDSQGMPKADDDRVEFFVVLLANSIVDEAGEKIFMAEDRRQILRALSFTSLSKAGVAALDLNEMTDKAAEAGEADRKKNSKSATRGPTPSSSPSS